jgi:MYXO-CTERM domain-containing protein
MWRVPSWPLAVAVYFAAQVASAAPKHDICADLGTTLGVGVSSFSAAGDWPVQAEQQYGVDWKLLYLYVVPTSDPKPDVESFLLGKATLAKSLGAEIVYTFYELLQIGQQNGLSGSEADVVKAVLADPALMKLYFDDFVFLLQTAAKADAPAIVQVEPDSWGFMMWAMGVEGNADATSIPVAVASSGHADVAGFSNDASGFAKALLALRDQYAPAVRMGWHASNFRVGQQPEVVTGFYSTLGEWDVIFSEQPHLEADESTWWDPWDATLLDTNVAWFSAVSSAAHVPILLWQAQIGTTDYHFFDKEPDSLERFAEAGLGAVLFDLRGSGNPDDFRAFESAALATVPPASSDAGGTAADMRTRLAAYAQNPLAWPAGSLCATGAAGAGSGGTGASSGSGGTSSGSGGAAGSSVSPKGDASGDESGCGCRVGGDESGDRRGLVVIALAAALVLGRRPRRTAKSKKANRGDPR